MESWATQGDKKWRIKDRGEPAFKEMAKMRRGWNGGQRWSVFKEEVFSVYCVRELK